MSHFMQTKNLDSLRVPTAVGPKGIVVACVGAIERSALE